MLGASSTCAGGPGLDHHALVHEHDPIGDAVGEVHLVGDHHHGHAVLGEAAHDREHLADELGIERRRRFVEEHHVRVHRQRPGDGDTLLLAAGQARRVLVDLVAQADPIEHGARRGLGIVLRALQDLPLRDREVAEHVEVREQVELLEHHADAGAHEIEVGVRIADVLTFDEDAPRRRLFETVDTTQQRRLARARRADDAHDLAERHRPW